MDLPDSPDTPIADPWTGLPPRWSVYVDDNFHRGNDAPRRPRGIFTTLDEAVGVCMEITRESVAENAGTEGGYSLFGDDPWVSPHPSAEELAGLLARHPDWPPGAFERGYFSAQLYASILQRHD